MTWLVETTDHQIRPALRLSLTRQVQRVPAAIVLDELGLNHGSVRVDLAIVTDRLQGFEIKSDRDDLHRLPEQIRQFSSALDRITLVVGWRHAVCALRLVPSWWGVQLVEIVRDGAVKINPLRLPEPNPAPDAYSVATLLWRSEALNVLESWGVADGIRSRRRRAIYERIAETISYHQLCSLVCDRLKMRRATPTVAQQTPGGG
jgi:hypothetical protein